MNILIDVGNSRVKWRIISNGCEENVRSFTYQSETLISRLEESGIVNQKHSISNVYISNVAGDEIKSKLIQWVADIFDIEAQFAVSRKEMCGLISAYNQADRLGIDRFLAMLGAQLIGSQPKVVVDCGTAVTVDSIDSNNEFVGGVILPGLSLMRTSLSNSTNALGIVNKDEDITLFATDTINGISSGTMLAITAVIENAVKKLTEIDGAEAKCIITGGDGKLIQSHLEVKADYQADLVLKGLSVYFQAK